MKIGIVGTRGIPNEYGGFEQFAEDFAVRMAWKGHDVTVYTSHNHSYKADNFRGVKLVHCYDPEYKIGTAGQFVYDFNCIKDSRRRKFDIILQLGYTSSTIWSWLFPKRSLLVTNMDGLEWKRSKYNKPVQEFLKYAERWAVKYSDYLIADSTGIQNYISSKYSITPVFIPYGANIYQQTDSPSVLENYKLIAGDYDLVVARFESENNIELILKAYRSLSDKKLVLVGKYEATAFGKRMYEEFSQFTNIVFLGSVFERDKLNSIRRYCSVYYHGHSVGGTNPSLLEAMACEAVICAHDNEFNKSVLKDNAYYFKTVDDVLNCINEYKQNPHIKEWITNNLLAIRNEYNWDEITSKLEDYFTKWLKV